MGERYAGCPKCGGKVATIEGRLSENMNVFSNHIDLEGLNPTYRRRRKCLECEYRYTSYEIIKDDFEEVALRLFRTEFDMKIKVLRAFLDDFFPEKPL